jgi:cytochrome c556
MRLFAILMLALCLPAGTPPATAQSTLSDQRAVFEKWVQTRQLIARVKADWQSDQDTLQAGIAMFERELKALDEQIAKADTGSRQVLEEKARLEIEKQQLLAASERVQALVIALEDQLKSLTKLLPEPVLEKVQPFLKRLPENPAQTKLTNPERLQTIIGVLNEVEKFHNAVSVVTEIRKNPAGAEVQVRTIYFGLGQAWFVDKAGEYAGTGVPGPNGWEWTAQNALAGKVARAIAVYENAAPAEFVPLPVTLR